MCKDKEWDPYSIKRLQHLSNMAGLSLVYKAVVENNTISRYRFEFRLIKRDYWGYEKEEIVRVMAKTQPENFLELQELFKGNFKLVSMKTTQIFKYRDGHFENELKLGNA
jgi:hypothetical protein